MNECGNLELHVTNYDRSGHEHQGCSEDGARSSRVRYSSAQSGIRGARRLAGTAITARTNTVNQGVWFFAGVVPTTGALVAIGSVAFLNHSGRMHGRGRGKRT